MSNNRCKEKTVSGDQCKLKAGVSGYCHIHDPNKKAERESAQKAAEEDRQKSWAKGKFLREVIQIVEATCETKGWFAHTSNLDRKNWRYTTISVNRSVRSGYSSEEITGVFDISLNEEDVRVAYQKTSFHSYGLQDLRNSIMVEIRRLPWVESKKKSSQPKPLTAFDKLENLLTRFHIVARQLRHRHNNRDTLIINDEYDVQDLLHALLKTIFADVREEDPAPNYAGASSRIDFLLKDEKIVVETKISSPRLRDKNIGEQLIIDIKRYQSHPDCEQLVCFVYNPDGDIKNPVALENDLSGKHDDIEVLVLVVPH